MMRTPPVAPGLLLLLSLVSLANSAVVSPVTLVDPGRSVCAITYPPDCSLSERTAQKLSAYLREQTDAQVPVARWDRMGEGSNSTLIVLDGTPGHEMARAVLARGNFSLPKVGGKRAESYRLATRSKPGAQALVLALGNSPAGAKYAVYHLMREMEIAGRGAHLRALDVSAEPFIKTRSVALFNVWGMPIDLTRRHNTESWSIDQLEAYVDMYDVFGFNAIESHDRFNDNYLEPLFGLRRADWRGKVLHMAEVAHQ